MSKIKLTAKQVKAYIKNGGDGCCPFCGGHSIEGSSWDLNGTIVYQTITCVCGAEWMDEYKLCNIVMLYAPEKVNMTKKKVGAVELSLYMGERVQLDFARYSNKRTVVQLNTMDGEPFATATVNLVKDTLAPGCVFVKDYSENEGMLQWLVDNKVVEATGRYVNCGFTEAPEARLLEPWLTKAGGKTS